ncbi:MAG: type VI secretion system lipoprotein TssJ [Proteobacteria bacterium]|nr:type VI secretion system lipoprotein TssJ [Pseudomonadota bacterium]
MRHKRKWGLLAVLVLSFGLGACAGSAPVRVECDYGYQKDAIAFDLVASPDLNRFNNQAHTVILVFYALSDPNSFNQLLESSEGLGRLLEGKRFDPSALSTRQIVVQPGENKQLVMDRVQGTRYVGVVGGFYNQQAQAFSRLYSIPTNKIVSVFGAEKGCVTEALSVSLELGSDGFVEKEQGGK